MIFSVEKILFVSLSDSSRLHQIPLKSFLRYYHRNREFYSLLPVWTTVWFFMSWSDAEISILPNWCCWSKNCKVVRLINWSNPSSQAAGASAKQLRKTLARGISRKQGKNLNDKILWEWYLAWQLLVWRPLLGARENICLTTEWLKITNGDNVTSWSFCCEWVHNIQILGPNKWTPWVSCWHFFFIFQFLFLQHW